MTGSTTTTSLRLGRAMRAGLALGAIAIVLTACAATSSSLALTGETWRLTAITEKTPAFQGVVPAAEQDHYTIEFNKDGSFDATADCNAVAGTYTTSGSNGLSVIVGSSTKVACPGGSLGDMYTAALGEAATYDISNEQLTITLKDGSTLTFTGVSLTGRAWQLGAIAENVPAFQGVVPPADQSKYTITFNTDGTFDATADCNAVGGAYATTRFGGLTISVGPSTRVACAEGSFGDAYVLALGRAKGYKILLDQLTITLQGEGTLTFTVAAPSASAEPSASAAVVVPPSASASASASPAPTATPTATPAPTAKPSSSPVSTPAPTAKPSTPPVSTPAPTTKTCKTSGGEITVTYPANWFTVTDVPEFVCLFFDPQPIKVDATSGEPIAAVRVLPTDVVTYDEALLGASDTKLWKGISKTATTVSGLPATQITGIANGAGSYPAGTVRYGYLVDWGTKGIVSITTTGPDGDANLAANEKVVDQIATSMVIQK